MAFDALYAKEKNFPKYSATTVPSLVCDEPSDRCWFNECRVCYDGKRFLSMYNEAFNEVHEVTWCEWENNDQNRPVKVLMEGTTDDLRDHIITMYLSFIMHAYTKREQSASYNALREGVEKSSTKYDHTRALLQVDFSENYTCIEQNEIQSGHWTHPSVTLFTYSLWYLGQQHSGVIASDSNVHAKETIIPFMDYILETIPVEIQNVEIFSDGPSSQFKSRYIVAAVPALEERHSVTITWNYFATSHGKGPVDGIGGSTKRYVWTAVRSGRAQVMNAMSFAQAAASMPNVKVVYMSDESTSARAAAIGQQAIFNAAPAVESIRRVHCFRYVNGQLRTADLSKNLNVSTDEGSEAAQPAHDTDTNMITADLREGQFITAVYDNKMYIAQVTTPGDIQVQVSFMRPPGVTRCNWSSRPDILLVPRCDILATVEAPAPLSSTSRFFGLSKEDELKSNEKFKQWKDTQ